MLIELIDHGSLPVMTNVSDDSDRPRAGHVVDIVRSVSGPPRKCNLLYSKFLTVHGCLCMSVIVHDMRLG